MKVELAYGRTGLTVELPDGVTVVEPQHVPAVADERAALLDALRRPRGTRPLRDLVGPNDTVAIVVPDITRPCPTDRILPPLLDELAAVPPESVLLINGTGMHRPSTDEELAQMLGAEVVARYRAVNHDAHDAAALAYAGTTRHGNAVWVNRQYLSASVKILVGFIEPHFFAGFSGGGKAVLPSIAGADSIMRNHSARLIGDPRATWGVTAGNPIFEEMREAALMTRPTFIVNVAINRDKRITAVYAGDLVAAHDAGTAFVRATAMQAVAKPFDVVVTTNGGYPLDLNLYQAIKGIAAAARIVRDGGAIVAVAECREGVPAFGQYRELLRRAGSPAAALELIHRPGFCQDDQWQVQIQAMVQRRAEVFVYSTLPPDEVRGAWLTPIDSVERTVEQLGRRLGAATRIAVLPQGPLTIPYVAADAKTAVAESGLV
ncbi:MAG: nickel-dependent lactate racemase [Chloroflexi bacterium]|nr:nickel-dependent lactate racemase [Chloroflexota bacterium]